MTSLEIVLFSSKAKVGDMVFVGILADSGGEPIEGLDVMLEPMVNLEISAYYPTGLIPVKNYANLEKGNISQLCNPGQALAVNGLIAVLSCRAIKKGTANIKFKFTAGSTIDTNMVQIGKDILTKVVNKRLTIS